MRTRRVKKICLWHIFSQSGEQAMLATQAEGWHDGSRDGRREKENEKKKTRKISPSVSLTFDSSLIRGSLLCPIFFSAYYSK